MCKVVSRPSLLSGAQADTVFNVEPEEAVSDSKQEQGEGTAAARDRVLASIKYHGVEASIRTASAPNTRS